MDLKSLQPELKPRVYAIVSKLTGKMYVGSSSGCLAHRIRVHLTQCKNYYDKGTGDYISSFEVLRDGADQCTVEILEVLECNTPKPQIAAREKFHIEANRERCVNRNLPGKRTPEEAKAMRLAWQAKNYDRLREKKKEHYAANRERIQTKNRLAYHTKKALKAAESGTLAVINLEA